MTNPDDDNPEWLGMAIMTAAVTWAALLFVLFGFN